MALRRTCEQERYNVRPLHEASGHAEGASSTAAALSPRRAHSTRWRGRGSAAAAARARASCPTASRR
eukprot:60080-Prymnesium_polylepis.1